MSRLLIVLNGILFLNALSFAHTVILPKQSTDFSVQTAKQALDLCSKHFADKTKAVFSEYGFSIVAQKYYDKDTDEVTHSSAFTLGRGKATVGGVSKETFLLVIRGTNGSEWYSNFDFAPSKSNDASFSENFLFSAQDIFLSAYELIKKQETTANPIILICGHSRGAACANILGVLFDAVMNQKNVYVYTFATPATMRGRPYDVHNIFNVINPCDLVPKVPLASWGYYRAGKDIMLGGAYRVKQLDEIVSSLTDISPTIESYYSDRHSITESGLSVDGITVYEVMELLSERLALITMTANGIHTSTASNESSTAFQLLASMSSESDFCPLVSAIQQLFSDNGYTAKQIVNEHMPETYMTLLDKMGE